MLSFQHADLKRLYEYWSARRPGDVASSPSGSGDVTSSSPGADGGAGLPSRHDIDPVDLGWMLDRISLFECHDNPLRFRCRVAGTWYSLRFDFEASGAWLHDWPSEIIRESATSIYRLIHADGRPRRIIRQFSIDGVATLYEGAALPLGAGQAGTASQPAAGQVHDSQPGVAMILVGAAPIAEADLAGLSLIFEAGNYRSWSSD